MNEEFLNNAKSRLLDQFFSKAIEHIAYNLGDVNRDELGVLRGELEAKYMSKFVSSELGSSTTLLELPDLDIEALYIGGNEKFRRVGCFFVVSLSGSSPRELAIDRVKERLERLSNDVEVHNYYNEFNDEDVDYFVVNECEVEEGSWQFRPEFMKEGKSMLNLNKDHYIWAELGFFRSGFLQSVDKDIMDFISSTLSRDLNTKHCIHCSSLLVGNSQVCPLCRHNYMRCDDCNKLTLISEGVSTTRFLCKECASKKKCRVCGRTLADNETVLCGRCSGLSGVLDYHTGLGRKDESGKSRLKIGYEVEKEDANGRARPLLVKLMRETGWVIERDGSLGEHGYELISPILPLSMSRLPSILEPLKDRLNAKTTDRCGGHIHISDTQRTPYQILLDIRGYLPLLYGLYPNRATNEYCEAKEKESYIQSGHRQAINVSPRTLEFRIFPAVRSMEQLLWRTELIHYMLTHKETDVVSIGKQLLNKESELYGILIKRISASNIRKKAQAFIDFTNYLDRDALVIEGEDIKRLIDVPKIKEEKEKMFEARALELSRNNSPIINHVIRGTNPINEIDYGYFYKLIND